MFSLDVTVSFDVAVSFDIDLSLSFSLDSSLSFSLDPPAPTCVLDVPVAGRGVTAEARRHLADLDHRLRQMR